MTTQPAFVVQCPSCHGFGEHRSDSLVDPPEPCGYCDFKGVITDRHVYYQVLGYLSSESKRKRKNWEAQAYAAAQ